MNNSPTFSPIKSFKIFKSSAGSGKTYTLVREYIALALTAPEEYHAILAVTFTNKAAKEMKERVLKMLSDLKEEKDPVLKAAIAQQTGIPSHFIAPRADALLTHIIHNYTRFSVSTIDSFTHKIVKTFARELGIHSRFDIETDQEGMMANIVDKLMNQIGKDKYVTHILSRFVMEKIDRQESWHLEADIKKVAKILFSEAEQAQVEALKEISQEDFKKYIAYLKAKIELYPVKMKLLAAEGEKMINLAGLEVDDFPFKSSGYVATFLKMDDCSKPADFIKNTERARFTSAVEDEQKRISKSGKKNEQVLAVWNQGLETQSQKILNFHKEEFQGYSSAWYAYQNIYSLAVLNELEALASEYKADQNVLTFSDFNFKIRDFILGEEPEYLYWRLGERFRHFLLDEFQDTSRLQWDNLLPLFRNNKADATDPGSLIFVGDTKQAIYRWRGGDIHIMEEDAPNFLETQPQFLFTNYRSKPHVIYFNNEIFRLIAHHYEDLPLLQSIYQDVEQQPRDSQQIGGYVQIEFLEKDSKEEEESTNVAHDRLLELVQEIQNEGIPLSEITVLVRNNTEASDIANLLAMSKLPFVASSSLFLNQSPVIQLLMALMKYLLGAKEPLLGAEIMALLSKKHAGFKPSEELEHLISDNLQQGDIATQIAHLLPSSFFRLKSQLNNITLYSLVENLIEIFELSITPNAFVLRFLDIILDFETRFGSNLAAFLAYWQENEHRFAIGLPEKGQGIKIMTIHKSKGLEFTIVIMPFVNWQLSPQKDHTIWGKNPESMSGFSKYALLPFRKDLDGTDYKDDYLEELQLSLLENINVLYVSFTRARERLYCLCKKGSAIALKSGEAKTMNDLLAIVMQNWDQSQFDGKVLKMGELVFPEMDEVKMTATTLDEFVSSDWKDRLKIRTGLTDFYAQHEATLTDEYNLKLRQGLIGLTSVNELEDLVQEFVERGILVEEEKETFTQDLKEICVGKLESFYKSDLPIRRRAEMSINTGDPVVFDRIIVKDKSITILNFPARKKANQGSIQTEVLRKHISKTGFKLKELAEYNVFTQQLVFHPI